jgi:hypothetical protein
LTWRTPMANRQHSAHVAPSLCGLRGGALVEVTA